MEVPEFSNLNLNDIVTPIDVDRYEELLKSTNYPPEKIGHLVKGFREGFDLGYSGPLKRQDTANNLPIKIGSKLEIWKKIMKEVQIGRYAGPFEKIPYENYIQSPIGLVPKHGGQTRLIFHLSYDFGPEEHQKSLNYHTPDDICKVKYCDLDYVVKTCLKLICESQRCNVQSDNPGIIYFSKTNVKSAFHLVPIKLNQRWLLIMKAYHPLTDKLYYFVDKNLPFGASISCLRFQDFSDSLKHITERFLYQKLVLTNYLDDYMVVSMDEQVCNSMMDTFLQICESIKCPIALDKTERAASLMVFLGVLMDGRSWTMAVPQEKKYKALQLLRWAIHKKKVTVHFIQQLTGTLNFLCKVIVPGRTFLRCMYDQLKLVDAQGNPLKKYHHFYLDQGFVKDCKVWEIFLSNATVQQLCICQPFIDMDQDSNFAETLNFYSDASLSRRHGGLGAVFLNKRWIVAKWESKLLDQDLSIEYLELFALFAGLRTWSEEKQLVNARVEIFCDNETVEHWVNNLTGNCKQSMKLIRMIALDAIKYNRKVIVKHVSSADNVLADAISRLDFPRFWKNAPKSMDPRPDVLPLDIWPATQIWFNNEL